MADIKIEDLPVRRDLTPAEQLELFGAGPRFRPNFEVLEERSLMTGQGALALTVASPAQAIHVSADSAYHIAWQGTDPATTGAYSVYYQSANGASTGLVPIATGLPETQTSYDWQVPAGLAGGTYTIYVQLQDAGNSVGANAPGSLTVDAAGSDRLVSAPVTASANYSLSYVYQGATYTAPYTLAIGTNALYPTVGGVTHEYDIVLVPTLTPSTQTTANSLGNVTSVTGANGQTTTYQYDSLSRLTQTNYPDGTSVAYTYNTAGGLQTMHDATGWQIYGYDILGRMTSVTYSPTNNASDPAALTIGYGYDADNNLTSLTYPSGKQVLYGYDNAGNLTSVTEVNPGQANLVTTYTYDSTTGQMTQAIMPNNTETLYSYDSSGNLIGLLNQQTSTGALIAGYQYTVNGSGQRTQVVITTPTGATAQSYQYDQLGRLTQVTYSNGATVSPSDEVVQYTFDSNGNRLTQTTYANGIAAGATQTLSYAYGPNNQLQSVTDQNGVVQAEYYYDWRGDRVMMVTPTGTTRYTYNAQNLLAEVDDGTNVIQYTYDGGGRRIAQSVNGVVTRFVVDPSESTYQTLENLDSSGNMTGSFTYGLNLINASLPGQNGLTYYLQDGLGSTAALTTSTGADLGNYQYDAFGRILTGPQGIANPYTYTGENLDPTTGLVYLRARYYDPQTGTYLTPDPTGFGAGDLNLYRYVGGNPVNAVDPSGLLALLNYETAANLLINNANYTSAQAARLVQGLNGQDIPIIVNGVQSIQRIAIVGSRAEAIAAIQTAAPGETLNIIADGNGSSIDLGGDEITPTDPLYQAIRATGISQVNQLACLMNANALNLQLTADTAGVSVTAGSMPADITVNIHTQAWGMGQIGAIAVDLQGRIDTASPTQPLTLGSPSAFTDTNTQFPSEITPTLTAPPITPIDTQFPGGTTPAPTLQMPSLDGLNALPTDPGGVLINKAATLVGSNLGDIAGATFDPTTGQIVFLGGSNTSAVQGVNLDYFTAAVESVYGSAEPPYVTWMPSAELAVPSTANAVLGNGQFTAIPISYAPFYVTPSDDMTLTFTLNNKEVTVRVNGAPNSNIVSGSRQEMALSLGTVTGAPAGVSVALQMASLSLNAQGQTSNWNLVVINQSGVSQTITGFSLVTDQQERQFGGRVDNTALGWVMEEADRVMKELAIGKDQLTGTLYNSQTLGLPAGFQNVLQLDLAGGVTGSFNDRLWFTPNQETLEQYVDPTTGQSTVVFSQSTVQLNSEAMLLAQPVNPAVAAFAKFFTTNYNAFANVAFPVHDPADPTGQRIIYVKIFAELEEAMKAVALARFFHDNNIPLDTWWINSYQPATAYIPQTMPTITNSIPGYAETISGGVLINGQNQYVASSTAQVVQQAVLSQESTSGGVQAYAVSATPLGSLAAVAASFSPTQPNSDITLAAVDLSVASPGGNQLSFSRFYNSGNNGDGTLGAGWQSMASRLEFQYPSYVDNLGLLRDSGNGPLMKYGADADTELHSGDIRFIDYATGQVLDFTSSLQLVPAANSGSTAGGLPASGATLTAAGLTAGDVPTFTPGQNQNGSTLIQNPTSKDYILTMPDGSQEVFDPSGNLLSTTDRRGYTITYTYQNGKLTQISDSAGQALTLTYNSSGAIQYVTGPLATGQSASAQRIAYSYDASGRLVEVDTQVLQAGGSYATVRSIQYQYNSSNLLTAVVGANGVTTLTDKPNSTGAATQTQDALGNTLNYTYSQANGVNTTTVTNAGNSLANNPLAPLTAALQYVSPGASATTQYDSLGRPTRAVDALGNAIQYGYTGSALVPSTISQPGQPTISIQYNDPTDPNLPTSISNPALGSATTQITYNAANLPVTITDPTGLVTYYTYTAWYDVQSVTVGYGTPLAETTTYNYDPASKLLTSIVDPLGHTIATYTYDSLGRVTSSTDGDGVTTSYTYDSLGRVQRVYEPGLTGPMNYIQYTYNDNNQVTQVATPTGNITYQYDPTTHNLIAETDRNGNTTQYGYDPTTGALTSVTQIAATGSAVTQLVYNSQGQVALVIAPNGARTGFLYNAEGQQTNMVEGTGSPPTATLTEVPTSSTSVQLTGTASQPLVVASLTYWLAGQPQSTASVQGVRLTDQTAFSFNLTGLTPGTYCYQLTLTDGVGLTQTLPQGTFTTLPGNLSVQANETGGALVNLAPATTAGAVSSPTVAYFIGSRLVSGPAFFPVGTTTVSDTITGPTGNLITGSFTVTVSPAPASQLVIVQAPSAGLVGLPMTAVTVQFEDQFNNPTASTGPVAIGLAQNSVGAQLSGTTESSAVNGVATFSTLAINKAGTYTLFAASSAGISSAVSAPVVVSPTTYFTVTGMPATIIAGQKITLTVTAETAAGTRDTTYQGTIRFASTDPLASLPADYTFSAADQGVHTFTLTLGTVGGRLVTVADTTAASVHGSSIGVSVTPGVATGFKVTAFPSADVSGVAHAFVVTAVDAYGNQATGYRGTVQFTTAGPGATLPANYTFTAADAGVHTFVGTLAAIGTQSLTVTDTVNPAVTGSESGINVVSPAAALLLSGAPTQTTAGATITVTVTVKNTLNQTDALFRDTIHFTSTDPQAVLPADYTFSAADAGTHTFTITLGSAGARGLTVTDVTRPTVAASAAVVSVAPGVATGFKITAFPSADVSGVAHAFVVTAVDAYGNQATGYRGTVFFTSSDPFASLPANYTFTAADLGAHTFVANLATVGSQTLLVADTMHTSVLGSQSGINVLSPAAGLSLSGMPPTITAGQAFTVTVTAHMATGALDAQFPDTIHFTSTDPQAVLPPDYTFQPGDSGTKTFTIILKTAGSRGLTVTDVTRPAVAASAGSTAVTAAAASVFQVAGLPASTLAGVARGFTVTARDAFGNQAISYRGTVQFTSSDAQATLPAAYTFQPGDAGAHIFVATFKSVGSQTLTVTDGSTASLAGQANIGVGLTPSVAGPTIGVRGQPLTFTLTATEAGQAPGAVFTYLIDWNGDGVVDQVVTGPNSISVSHVFATTGVNNVRVRVEDSALNVSPQWAVLPVTIQSVALEADPADSTKTALAVGGTTGNDTILITPADPTGRSVWVTVNGVLQPGGPFAPTGHILVYGQSGNDNIQVAAASINGQPALVAIPAILFAGSGNTALSVAGSDANNVLVGGGGTDTLTAGQGRDILIGGGGAVTLQGGAGDDILIGGSTVYDVDPVALAALAAEWGRTDRNYQQRVQDLAGTGSGGLNGAYLLDSGNVTANTALDQIIGGTGLDWFWMKTTGGADKLSGYASGEQVTVE